MYVSSLVLLLLLLLLSQPVNIINLYVILLPYVDRPDNIVSLCYINTFINMICGQAS